MDCRGYGTPSMGGSPVASYCGSMSLSRGMQSFRRRLTLLLIQSNLNDRSCVRVSALGRHSPIYLFDFNNLRKIQSVCICQSRRSRLMFE